MITEGERVGGRGRDRKREGDRQRGGGGETEGGREAKRETEWGEAVNYSTHIAPFNTSLCVYTK